MAKWKPAAISVFLLVYVQYCLVVSQVVESGFPEVNKNGVIIYEISQLIDDLLERGKEDRARDLLQNVLKEEEVYLHYETGTEIQDLSQLSNVLKLIHKITFWVGNPQIKLFISVRNSITSFKIPASDATTIDFVNTSSLFAIIFPIDCGENSNLKNESSALIRSLHSRHILVGFHHHPTSSCHPSKDVFTESDFLFNAANFTTQVGFPESYTIFKNHLQSRADQTAPLKNSTSSSFYLRLDSFSNEIPPETDIEYNLLLLQFGQRWSKESESSVIIRFSSPTYFSKLSETKRTKRSVSQSGVIIPFLDYYHPTDPTPSVLLGALDKISSISTRIQASYGDWAHMAYSLDQLESGQKLSQPLKASVNVGNNLNVLNQTVSRREKLEKRNVLLEYLNCGMHMKPKNPYLFESVVVRIPVLCIYEFGHSSILPATVVQKTRETCGFSFDQAAAFQWDLYIDFSKAAEAKYSLEFYTSHVQQRLNEALLARKEIRVVKPNVTVRLKMYSRKLPSKGPTFNFYCNETLLKINAYHEAITTWAEIHDFPVALFNVYPDFEVLPGKITWLSRVKVSSQVSQDITKNTPVYVLRNFGEKSPFPNLSVDSCVKWSAEVAQEGIPLDRDLTGGTVLMNFRNEGLLVNELETVLLFAVQKFKTVELLPRNDAIGQLRDLKTLNALLDTDFLEAMVHFDVLGGRLYLEISMENTTLSQILEQVEKVAERISVGPEAGLHFMGVHLRDWKAETSQEAVVGHVVALGERYNFKVGLVVNNCATLLNNLVTNSISVPSSDYILCQTYTFPAYNEDKDYFSTNFDTHLYMSKIFEKFLPGRAIYFRVNSSPCCDGDSEEKKTDNLFRFLNDANQFAVGNKLKHFLVQAFPTSSGTTSSSNWFQVENYTDLSDVSVFTDREAVMNHNKSIWRPPSTSEREERRRQRENKTKDSSTGPSTETVLIVMAGVIIVATIVITLVAFHRYRTCITWPFCRAGNEGNSGGLSEYVEFNRDRGAADEE